MVFPWNRNWFWLKAPYNLDSVFSFSPFISVLVPMSRKTASAFLQFRFWFQPVPVPFLVFLGPVYFLQPLRIPYPLRHRIFLEIVWKPRQLRGVRSTWNGTSLLRDDSGAAEHRDFGRSESRSFRVLSLPLSLSHLLPHALSVCLSRSPTLWRV